MWSQGAISECHMPTVEKKIQHNKNRDFPGTQRRVPAPLNYEKGNQVVMMKSVVGYIHVCCLGFSMSVHTGHRSQRSADVRVMQELATALSWFHGKRSKYSALDSTLYRFFPIAIECMGVFDGQITPFSIKNLGIRITLTLRKSSWLPVV